jgi:hypothetical protein
MGKKIEPLKKEPYIVPDIEVVEIVIEQNIFEGSGTGLPGMGGEDW